MSDFNRTDDIDPIETQEWLDSINSMIEAHGPERAHFIISSQVKNREIY